MNDIQRIDIQGTEYDSSLPIMDYHFFHVFESILTLTFEAQKVWRERSICSHQKKYHLFSH